MNTYECLNSTLLYTEDKDYQPSTVSVRVLLRKSPRFSDYIRPRAFASELQWRLYTFLLSLSFFIISSYLIFIIS